MHDMAEADLESRDQTEMEVIEVKPSLCLLKEEMEPQEGDEEKDDVTMSYEAEAVGSIQNTVQAGTPLPMNGLLSMESRIEEGSWNTAALMKQEMNVEDLNEAGRRNWREYSGLEEDDPKKSLRKKKRKKLDEEEAAKLRERNKLYMRKHRAAQTPEQIEKRREKGRLYKRLYNMRLTPEEVEKQRELNRLYMRKHRAAQTPEQVEKRREKGRLYKQLFILRQTPEETERQKELNRIYMQKRRAEQSPKSVAKRRKQSGIYKQLHTWHQMLEDAESTRKVRKCNEAVDDKTTSDISVDRPQDRQKEYTDEAVVKSETGPRHTSYMWPYVLHNQLQWKPGKPPETIEMRREKQRLQKRRSRASKSEEELAKEREQNRLYKKKVRSILPVDPTSYAGACTSPRKQERPTETDEERRERQRLQKRQSRASMSEESLAKERERNKLYKRKIRAALLEQASYTGTYVPHSLLQWRQGRPLETLEERREKQRLQKRQSRARMSEEALAKERERNRMHKRKVRAALSMEQIERRRQEERTDMAMCHLSRFDVNTSIFKPNDKTIPNSVFSPDQLNCERESNGDCTPGVENTPSTASEDQNPMSRILIENKRKPAFSLLPGQFEQQREGNQNCIRSCQSSISEDKLQARRERERILQRMTQEMIKERTCASVPILNAEQLQSQREDNRNSVESTEMPSLSEKEDQNPLLGSYLGNKTNSLVFSTPQHLEHQREYTWNHFTKYQNCLPENDQKREHDWVRRRRMREMVREQTKKLKNLFMESGIDLCEIRMAQENMFVADCSGSDESSATKPENSSNGVMAMMMDSSYERVNSEQPMGLLTT
ncbi:hypothetical protein C0J52_17270 [Blattella germanica]|nr:hypothetical protein C0J52_17270 [Blattella germanica]